jgi:hypothetical protein
MPCLIQRETELRTEQRNFKRVTPGHLTFAVARPDFEKIGRVTDISRDGLAYEYLAGKDLNNGSRQLELDIFISGGEFYMYRIPCELVYDLQGSDNVSSGNDLEHRRRGLQFNVLSKEQKGQLDFFLRNYAKND